MSCEHEVRFTIKPTDDACRFHFDVRAYKDRIVAPDEYSGATEVTPSHMEQVLATKDKLVRDDITVYPAPVETLSTTSNGTFTPSEGKVGFSQVDVNVNPDLRPLTINSLTQSGVFVPDGFDGYNSVNVEEEWDGILYPIEGNPDNIFNAKYVEVKTGDKVIVEGVGSGRWLGFRNPTTNLPTSVQVTKNTTLHYRYDHVRFMYDVDCDCILVLAGYTGSPNGGHSYSSSYQFRGEYLRYKIIHAT